MKTLYEARDGRQFPHVGDCQAHEQQLVLTEVIRTMFTALGRDCPPAEYAAWLSKADSTGKVPFTLPL